MTDSPENRTTALDYATDAIVRFCGTSLDDPVLATYVDTFTDQLGDVAVRATSAHEIILAGIELAKQNLGPVAAGWIAYVEAIRRADRNLSHAAAAMVSDAEAFLEEPR